MEIVITDHPGEVVADVFEQVVRSGARTLGLATGSSPLPVYAELVRRHRQQGLSFAGVCAVMLDEYVGLASDHPQSYARFIRANFADLVDLGALEPPNGIAADVFAEARRYDELIATLGGVDLQILGIGANGHLGFNEPSSSLRSRTRLKTLTQRTREDNARFFESLDDVPHHVITQGLGTICEARQLVLIATGEAKAAAVAAAAEGPLSASCPASVLQWHPHATAVIDEAAASQLTNADYYRQVLADKPAGQLW